MSPRLHWLLLALTCLGLIGCGSVSPEVAAQRERISQEPLGDYYVGRRFNLLGTRLWGYVRRPREHWEKARLVVMNERSKKQPDRLPELNLYGNAHGFDHNYEYHLQGQFNDSNYYDPNSNLVVPQFLLTGFTEITKDGGFLLSPGDTSNQRRLPELR